MSIAETISVEAVQALGRLISGKLLSDQQISSITNSVIGKYFADFFPNPKDDLEVKSQAEAASRHLTEAATILAKLQEDLKRQSGQLDKIVSEIEEKKEIAGSYDAATQNYQKTLAANREEFAKAVRAELNAYAERRRRFRQVIGLLGWLLTLVLGAVLGAYMPNIMKHLPFLPQPGISVSSQTNSNVPIKKAP